MNDQHDHHDPHYARGDPIYEAMLNELSQDECGLCTLRVHPKPILLTVGDGSEYAWRITERFTLPEDIDHYWLILPVRHLERLEDMTPADYGAVHELVCWASRSFSLEGFGLMVRSGASRRTGASSTKHIHYHLIVPSLDEQSERAKPYNFPIG